jgi:hypothetical protein
MNSTDEHIEAIHAVYKCHPMPLIHSKDIPGIKECIPEGLKLPCSQVDELSAKTAICYLATF